MTLADIANVVCTKVNQLDAEDLAAAKLFAARRHELIWNEELWKDSIVEWDYTLPGAYDLTQQWLPTKQVLLLPTNFQRVLAVRTTTRHLNVQSYEFYFKTDFDAFQQSGALAEFIQLPPAVWEFDTAQRLDLVSSPLDSALSALTDLVAADGQPATRTTTAFSASDLNLGQVVRADSFSKNVTQAAVSLGIWPIIITNSTGAAVTFTVVSVLGTTIYTIAAGASQTIYAGWGGITSVSAPAFPAAITVFLNTGPYLANGFAGTVTWDGVHFTQTLFTNNSSAYNLSTLQASDTSAPKRCRIKLMGVPDAGTTLRILGKTSPPPLTSDNDSPGLSNVENCLMAFVQGDMLQRERQYSKAAQTYQEAAMLLDQLHRVEAVQQAYNKRIMPEDGYGNPYDLWSHPPLTF